MACSKWPCFCKALVELQETQEAAPGQQLHQQPDGSLPEAQLQLDSMHTHATPQGHPANDRDPHAGAVALAGAHAMSEQGPSQSSIGHSGSSEHLNGRQKSHHTSRQHQRPWGPSQRRPHHGGSCPNVQTAFAEGRSALLGDLGCLSGPDPGHLITTAPAVPPGIMSMYMHQSGM